MFSEKMSVKNKNRPHCLSSKKGHISNGWEYILLHRMNQRLILEKQKKMPWNIGVSEKKKLIWRKIYIRG